MPSAPSPTPVQALAPDLARRFGLIIAGLAALVARRFLREPRLARLIVPLWTRLTRAASRFDRLMARLAANRLAANRLAANRLAKPRPPRRRRPTPNTARTALPASHGWLLRALPNEAAAYAAQLDALLAEPATADLLAAHPAAARILRPLGRMLGLGAPAPKRNAPKRNAPKPNAPQPNATERNPPNRRPQPASPSAAAHRRPIPPPPADPSYRPSARWPRAHWPRPQWPADGQRRAAPA